MDILIFYNGSHTRTYLNAKISKENRDSFEVTYNSYMTVIFNKDKYSYIKTK